MPTAIVPAAGRSRRMGRPKLLLPLPGGGTVVGGTVAALVEGGVARVCLVVGPSEGPDAAARDARRLRRWAEAEGLGVAVNPEPERGMLSSILAGLDAVGGAQELAASGETVLVTPADLPYLRPSTVRAVLAARDREGAELAVPIDRGERGHPLAIAPRVLPEIPSLDLSVGLRQLLDRHPDGVLEVPVDDPGSVGDLDTPRDYERLSRPPG